MSPTSMSGMASDMEEAEAGEVTLAVSSRGPLYRQAAISAFVAVLVATHLLWFGRLEVFRFQAGLWREMPSRFDACTSTLRVAGAIIEWWAPYLLGSLYRCCARGWW